MTKDPCPSIDQTVETTTLRRHSWTAAEYSIEILPGDLQIKNPQDKGLNATLPDLSRTEPFSSSSLRGGYIYFLFPKLQGSFFCLCSLFPEPMSSTARFFYLCDLLHKLLSVFESWLWILSQPKLEAQGLTPGAVLPLTVKWKLSVWLPSKVTLTCQSFDGDHSFSLLFFDAPLSGAKHSWSFGLQTAHKWHMLFSKRIVCLTWSLSSTRSWSNAERSDWKCS